MSRDTDRVIVVGAGLAGLACALDLDRAGIDYLILEGSDRVGGRVATDRTDGFVLDRGFQTYLPAYPEAAALLDHDALGLEPFYPGVLVHNGHAFHRVVDPLHEPSSALGTVTGGVLNPADLMRMLRLRQVVMASDEGASANPPLTTETFLRHMDFSERAIERFFRPFCGAVLLDSTLMAPAGLFKFLFRAYVRGGATLPARGMDTIPDQLASRIAPERIELATRVNRVTPDGVELFCGRSLAARRVVVATDQSDAECIIGSGGDTGWFSTGTVYFAAERSPLDEPILALNGDGRGPIAHVCVPSDICASYAPPGASLVSVTLSDDWLIDRSAAQAALRAQLVRWFGDQVNSWQHLSTCYVPQALPRNRFVTGADVAGAVRVDAGLYRCGDYLATPSINGAIASGRAAAKAAIADARGEELAHAGSSET